MKIAIPTANGKLAPHFGHCQHFAIATVDSATAGITDLTMIEPPPHQPGLLPNWLAEHQVKLVIADGMGQRALDLFAGQNIDVIIGAPVAPAIDLIESFLAGTLEQGVNACSHDCV